MHLLGRHLPDHKPLRIALTKFYGISHPTSSLLLARLSIPLSTRVQDLTEGQVTSLSSFLSSPSTAPPPPQTPLLAPTSHSEGEGEGEAGPSTAVLAPPRAQRDPLDGLLIETDLRRKIQGDIIHLRQVGTYRGRRHALGLPVRGQNTRNNAKTAKKLNRVERRGFASFAPSSPSSTQSLSDNFRAGLRISPAQSRSGTGGILSMLSSPAWRASSS